MSIVPARKKDGKDACTGFWKKQGGYFMIAFIFYFIYVKPEG